MPTFMIAAAPKCGTTAIYEYLQAHPQVFLSDPKEPHYHAEDLGDHRSVFSRSEYLDLYRGATDQHLAIGDASVWSMHSSVALPKLRQESPEIKLIVMLRHPIDLLRSLHSDFLWICFEDERDFEKAWRLQDQRRAGEAVPRLCQVPWFLDYSLVGRLGSHLSRLLDLFPREQVKIVLFDDFKNQPAQIYEEILSFLELPSDGRREFPQVNSRKQNRMMWLARLQTTVVQGLPRAWINAGKRIGLGKLSRGVARLNTQSAGSEPLSAQFRRELIAEFKPDIELLEDLLARDLSHWKTI